MWTCVFAFNHFSNKIVGPISYVYIYFELMLNTVKANISIALDISANRW